MFFDNTWCILLQTRYVKKTNFANFYTIDVQKCVFFFRNVTYDLPFQCHQFVPIIVINFESLSNVNNLKLNHWYSYVPEKYLFIQGV